MTIMLGWVCALLPSSWQQEEYFKGLARRASENLYSFHHSQKRQLRSLQEKTNKRREAKKTFLAQLFRTLYRDRFAFVFDWVGLIHL